MIYFFSATSTAVVVHTHRGCFKCIIICCKKEKEGAGSGSGARTMTQAVQIQCTAFLIPTQGFSLLFNASTQVHATPPVTATAIAPFSVPHFICKHL